jgi:hypothetical protein
MIFLYVSLARYVFPRVSSCGLGAEQIFALQGHPCAEDCGGEGGWEGLKELFAKPKPRDAEMRANIGTGARQCVRMAILKVSIPINGTFSR